MYHVPPTPVAPLAFAVLLALAAWIGATRRQNGQRIPDEMVGIVLAAAWLVACYLVLQVEGFRERLATRFLVPAGVSLGLIWAIPLLAGSLGAAATGYALHRSALRERRGAAACLAGGGAGLGLAMLIDRPSVIAAVAPLLLFAATGLRLAFRSPAKGPGAHTAPQAGFRRGVLDAVPAAAVFVGAVLVAFHGRGGAPRLPSATPAAAAPSVARAIVDDLPIAPGATHRVVDADALAFGRSDPSFWSLGLTHDRSDVIVLSGSRDDSSASVESRAGREWGRRLIRRLHDCLHTGGRLLIERPTLPQVEWALRRHGAHAADAAAQAYVLTVSDSDGSRTAVVIGRDVPAWLGRLPQRDGCSMTLRRWRDEAGRAVEVARSGAP